MTFRSAVEATPDIQNAWRTGLQALRRTDRRYIQAEYTRRIAGSVDLDAVLRKTYPNASRWDYAIGYRLNDRGEMVHWIEVHPATDGAIKELLNKVKWLKNWLMSKAPDLDGMPREFIWVSSGKTSFTATSPQVKRLAAEGIRHTGRRFTIGL